MDRSTDVEMKPCPFCGHKGFVEVHTFHALAPTYGVVCLKCGAHTSPWYYSEAKAVEAWNRRIGEE